MAASCSLVCCKEDSESDRAVVVRFSNGSVQNPDRLDFTMFKSTDETNPRKKNRRILVAESDRLPYVGKNFGPGSLKCNNLCKYYVGLLNKQTMQMEMHSAEIFNMQPVIPGEETASAAAEDAVQSYRDKVDSLIEAFGTNKQKRALNSRRLNQVGSETLHKAVAKAANTVIDQKGLEALQQEVAETEAQAELANHIPPCDADADLPENVYKFEDLLGTSQFQALEEGGSKMAELTSEELQKMRDSGRSQCVVKLLESLPTLSEEMRDKTSRCAFYLSLLFKLARQKMISRKFGQEDGCPRVIQNHLLRTFTVEIFNNGRVQNMVPSSMRVRIAAYSLALILHMNHMMADLTELHHDLGLTEARMIEIAKSMRLTLIKTPRAKADEGGLREEHRQATLVLPLAKYDQSSGKRKRKR